MGVLPFWLSATAIVIVPTMPMMTPTQPGRM
jgi:hypothetical protein